MRKSSQMRINILHPLVLPCIFLLNLILVISGLNSFGWGLSFRVPENRVLYLLCVFFLFLGTIFPQGRFRSKKSKPERFNSAKYLEFFFVQVSIAFVFKGIELGGYPLINNVSRYVDSSGYFDYFLSIYVLVGIFAFQKFLQLRALRYLAISLACLSFPILLQNRQDTVYLILGFCFVYFSKKTSLKGVLGLATGASLAILSIVQIAIIRFGDGLRVTSIFSLSTFDVIRAELQSPYFLGNYALTGKSDLLLGRYSVSEFFWFLFPSDSRGASYVNSNFVGVGTAQSVGFPFGYVLDFGWIGAFLLCFIAGLIGTLLFSKTNGLRFENPDTIIYILFLLTSLWSLRSGLFPFSLQLVFWIIIKNAIYSTKPLYTNTLVLGSLGGFTLSIIHLLFF